jgi:S-adenosylmethionine synthetase
MKILICGGSGILGRSLCNLFSTKNIPYVSTYYSNPIDYGYKINFMDFEDIKNFFVQQEITVCINCIVERQVEICEKNWEKVVKTNIEIPDRLAKICSSLNVFLIHISTDYIFDGQEPPYDTESLPNPLQNYGISKLISELRIRKNCSKYSIVRVPVLYTDEIKNLEETAVTLIGKKIMNRVEIFTEDNYSIRRPNFIADFVNFIFDLTINQNIGIFHFCNPFDKVTKYNICEKISKILGKRMNVIPINVTRENVTRPLDTLLIDSSYDIKKYNFTALEKGLEKCFLKYYHPNIKENTNQIFLLIDLDGTLIDSDEAHYQSYHKTIKDLFGVELDFLTYQRFCQKGLDQSLTEHFGKLEIIKSYKTETLYKYTDIQMISGAKEIIDYISENNINHVIVTNTSRYIVDFYKSLHPILNKLKNWITREDYKQPKPSPECYSLAKTKFYNNEKYIIGFENTLEGYYSLKNQTDCIYLLSDKQKNNYEICKHLDAYIIKDWKQILD